MARLRTQGLTRHDSIHAIAWVVLEHINELFSDKIDGNNLQSPYEAAVEKLSAKSWRGLIIDEPN